MPETQKKTQPIEHDLNRLLLETIDGHIVESVQRMRSEMPETSDDRYERRIVEQAFPERAPRPDPDGETEIERLAAEVRELRRALADRDARLERIEGLATRLTGRLDDVEEALLSFRGQSEALSRTIAETVAAEVRKVLEAR